MDDLDKTRRERWSEIIADLINQLQEDHLDTGKVEGIENLCIDTLDQYGIMEFQILVRKT